MSIIASPSSVLNPVVRNETFSQTITFTADALEVITSANCVKNFVDSSVVVANGVFTVVINGKHDTAFNSDEIKYVEKGSSDILQEPTILNNVSLVPPDKDLYEFNQDPSEGKIRTYTVTVTHSAGSNVFTFSQFVDNDVTLGYNFLQDYF